MRSLRLWHSTREGRRKAHLFSGIVLEDAGVQLHASLVVDGATLLCTVRAHGAQTQPLATLSWQGVAAHGSANAHEGQHTTHIGRPIAQHKVFS